MYFINIIVVIITIMAYTLPFFAPKAFPVLSVFTLFLPFFLILNFLFFAYWLLQFKKYFFISGLILLIGITFINRFYRFADDVLPKEPLDFTIMSYNVRLFNIYEWLPKKDVALQISNFIKEKNADILCLQEYAPNKEVNTENYKYSYIKLYGNKNKYGQAIFSKYKIINRGEVAFANSSNNVIFADVVLQEDTVRIYSMHLQSIKISTDIHEEIDSEKSKFLLTRIGKAFAMQQQQAEVLKEHYSKVQYSKIICGDLNNSAFSYVYRTVKGNMQDAFAEAGKGFGKTYHFKNYPARIDYIFADKTLLVKSFASYDTFYQSDHFPIFSRLAFLKN